MTTYRVTCELLVDAVDAARATDMLRDALAEIDATVDVVTEVVVSEPLTAADVLFDGIWEVSPEVYDEGVA